MTPGFHWTLRPSVKEDDPVLKAFPAELPLLVKQLLLQRGFTGGMETELFLDPRLSHLSDPFLMGEMRAAVDRIFRAVDEGETVCIYGDYDVDGVTSVALLRAILMAYDLDPQYFFPSVPGKATDSARPASSAAFANVRTLPVCLLRWTAALPP